MAAASPIVQEGNNLNLKNDCSSLFRSQVRLFNGLCCFLFGSKVPIVKPSESHRSQTVVA